MIQEAIEYLQRNRRPETLVVTERGKYTTREVTAVYSDEKQEYIIPKPSNNVTNVKSVTAFQQFIKEELTRLENTDGQGSTIQIDIEGGRFVANDNFGEGICKYTRILSQQWQLLKGIDGRVFSHEELLAVLLKLSPSIEDFNVVYKNFLALRIIGKSELVSNPVYVNNQAKSGYMCEFKIDGVMSEAIIPERFSLKIPYAKASKEQEVVPVEVQVLNNGNDRIQVKLSIPTLENIEEEAIIKEVEGLKKSLKTFNKMLVLSDI